jgi:hypothetical protein
MAHQIKAVWILDFSVSILLYFLALKHIKKHEKAEKIHVRTLVSFFQYDIITQKRKVGNSFEKDDYDDDIIMFVNTCFITGYRV